MGEAKRRAAARNQQELQLGSIDIPLAASVLRQICAPVSSALLGTPGKDAFLYVMTAEIFLSKLGIKPHIVVGEAAWRLGNSDEDVIYAEPSCNCGKNVGLSFHVWLEMGHHIFDITTHNLRSLAKQYQDLDNRTINVDWCPEYLFVKKDTVGLIANDSVRYFYKQNTVIERLLLAPDKMKARDCFGVENLAESVLTVYRNFLP